MAGQTASRFKDLARVASGLALVVNESVQRVPAIGKLKAGDVVGSSSAALKFLQNTVADITGLTRGRLHSYPNSSVSHIVRDSNEGVDSVKVSRSAIENENGGSAATRSTVSQPEELFRPSSSTGDGHTIVAPEPINETTTPSLKSELYNADCLSGTTDFSSRQETFERTIDPGASETRHVESDASVPPSNLAAQVLQQSSEEKATPSSPTETGGVPGGSSRTRIPGIDRPVKKRKPRERRVPSTPIGRAIGFAGLGAGLAWGGLQESAKRLWGGQSPSTSGQSVPSPFLTEQNAERIALALCRMRGAALKVGQMLSIQDESLVPPQVLAALESVRQGADVMPRNQLNKVLDKELGPGWKDRLNSFDYEPIAAASIGQVHRAVLKDGREVAMKVQYPGVANSIDSDIENVKRLLSYTNLIPKGLYLDQAMKVAKAELARECNYELEAEYQTRFRELLEHEQGLHVPQVIDEFCSKCVLTTELVPGVAIDKVAKMDQNVRNRVGAQILHLTLKELFVFRFMQTDPNWGNFLYDESTSTINLIDFGAAREFPKRFVDDYLRMVIACANKDREQIIEMSIRLGFLTGEEELVMMDAHTEAAFVTGEPFSKDGLFDFGSTNLPRRVSELGATMLRHRLTSPPDEAYSLHRKLSGAFLACVKLGAVVPCREMLLEFSKNYEFSESASSGATSVTAP